MQTTCCAPQEATSVPSRDSEHLFAQAVQILPVYALTGNIILSYNLLFLSTFVLSGLGTYLFVRDVTGSRPAALTAGLIYAFAPYRVPQFAHLQVLSSQWMPFALYAIRRYFESVTLQPNSTNWRPLAGAGVALVAQNLSNGYFLLFFPPIAAAYVLFEIASRRLWRNRRVWTAVTVTAAGVAVLTLPFVTPYLELRRLGALPPRSLDEVSMYSADIFSYWTAPAESRVWGQTLRAFPKPEGELFPTLTALLLAVTGLIASARSPWKESARSLTAKPGATGFVYALLGICAVCVLLLLMVLTGGAVRSAEPLPITVRGIGRPSLVLAFAFGALIAVSPITRSFTRAWLRTVTAFVVLAAIVAFIFSLGPEIRTQGRVIGEMGPYSILYSHVPGFDGLRVPARYAMVVMLFVAVIAGFGAAAIARGVRRGGAVVVCLGLVAVTESFAAPIVLNGTAAEGGYAVPPGRVYTGARVPPVYRFLKTLPSPGTVIVEFPFGEWGYELRYIFYSINHWHPLLNGYSGAFPLSYGLRASVLRHPLDAPVRAWKSLVDDGATHAVVHESLYLRREGEQISRWLAHYGAREVAQFDGDRVFALR
jgi:hypothetical protein